MKTNKICRNRTANIYVEYALVLGIVSLVFIAMNLYMKRGIQGRLADLSDNFIGKEQAADANPTANVTSSTVSNYTANLNTDEFEGGRMKLALLESRNIEATSKVVDDPKSRPNNFVAADEGYADAPSPLTEDDYRMAYDPDYEDKKAQIAILKKIRDVSLAEAESLEEVANTLNKRGDEIIAKAGGLIDRTTTLFYWPYLILWDITRNSIEARAILRLPPPDGTCRVRGCFDATVKLYRSGKELIARADGNRKQAADLREEAQRAEERIAELSREIKDE